MIGISLVGTSLALPVVAASATLNQALIAELGELIAREPQIVRRFHAQRGLAYCERLFAEEASCQDMVRLAELCRGDPRAATLVLGVFGLKGLEPDLAFNVLQRGLAAGGGKNEIVAAAESLFVGGTRREQVLAAAEGREWIDPASQPVPDIPIVTELGYAPYFHPDFPPVIMMLKRQGKDCPIVIERVGYQEAERVLAGMALDELRSYGVADFAEPSRQLILLARTLDGEVQGISIAFLMERDDRMSLQWDRVRKVDQDKRTHIVPLGLALLCAQLHFMKRQGHWQEEGDLVCNIDLAMLNKYRDRYGSPRRPWWPSIMMTHPTDSIDRREAEFFLSLPDFATQEVTLPLWSHLFFPDPEGHLPFTAEGFPIERAIEPTCVRLTYFVGRQGVGYLAPLIWREGNCLISSNAFVEIHPRLRERGHYRTMTSDYERALVGLAKRSGCSVIEIRHLGVSNKVLADFYERQGYTPYLDPGFLGQVSFKKRFSVNVEMAGIER